MNKRYITIICAIAVIAALFVGYKIQNSKYMYHDLNRLDNYLYEITYDDYKYDTNLETVINIENFGCSSVKNGNFYGRNFDFIFNDVPEFVVKVNKKGNRHASIGVTTYGKIHASDNIENEYIKNLELLPNFMLDGINDSGLVASSNVVPKNDVIPVTGTNESGEKLHLAFVVRYVLDNASSADQAIELLRSKNIYGDVGSEYNLHIMIADRNKTYVVEFIDNKMIAEEKTKDNQIMTNYYVNMPNYTENSAGIERYNILKQNYNEGNSFEGMWNLMQKVKFSKAYLFNKDKEWDSDLAPQSQIKNKEYYKNLEELKKQYWVARAYDQRKLNNPDYWQTTHNSTYDLSKKKLRVTIQENYDNYYEYTLD